MNHHVYISLLHFGVAFSLSCDEILERPQDKKLTMRELQTIQPKDIVQCLAHIGKEQLENSEAVYVWQSIIGHFGGVASIPDDVLMTLHWITPALKSADYNNITFSNIDVIQNFGLNYNLNMDQLSTLANRVREDFAGKEPEDYTYYDLNAIRQILCAFNRSEIERIHPSAYREAAIVIGKLENCNPEVMEGFASLAIQASAFGLPNTWSEATKKALGKIVDFVPQDVSQIIDTSKNVNATDKP
ncbi:uncharacterized protein LOC128683120 [Plodia interpunctella]|uniref:uncharacterized protein LOC128683120 n=1 Tax=Plodia interpunctella TaxID=58824 RepID=UPI002368175F|nr:uncharacterized protein LOC128683120 [Plodia interpunctella]